MIGGIYEIVNINNGNKYIGSSTNVHERLTGHKRLLSKNKHFSKHLQSAWNKYGSDCFRFSVLFYCDYDNLFVFEQRAIDYLIPKYNTAICAEAPRRGLALSEDHKRKIGISNKYKNTGKKCTIETRQKMSAAQIGHVVTKETREKIGMANSGRTHSDEQNKNQSIAIKKYWERKHELPNL
jgi:group I intron endonuclease